MIAVLRVNIKFPGTFNNPPFPTMPMISESETRHYFKPWISFSLENFIKKNTFGTLSCSPYTLFPDIDVKDIGKDYVVFSNELYSTIFNKFHWTFFPWKWMGWNNFDSIIVFINGFHTNTTALGFTGPFWVPRFFFPFWYLFPWARKQIQVSICPIVEKTHREYPTKTAYHEYLHNRGYWHVAGKKVGNQALFYGYCRMAGNMVALSPAHFYTANLHNYSHLSNYFYPHLNPQHIYTLVSQNRILEFDQPIMDDSFNTKVYALDFCQNVLDYAQLAFLIVIRSSQYPGRKYFIELRRKTIDTYDENLTHPLAVAIHHYDPTRTKDNNFIFEEDIVLIPFDNTTKVEMSMSLKSWNFGIIITNVAFDQSYVDLKICGIEAYYNLL